VGAVEYYVVGVMEREGSLFGIGTDNTVLVPLGVARTRFLAPDSHYLLNIMPVGEDETLFEQAWERAVVVMKLIRGVRPQDKANFAISRSDSVIRELETLKGKLSIAALVIGLITLLGASVGLMNILLVSVKERTSEIGIRKALGAKPRIIAMQFLAEAVLVGQIGCAAGLLMGLLFGNVVALLIGCAFTLPWRWLGVAVIICLVVSILSGYLPARRASRLDPIEALRCE
jgi:putative ABC transport system permease protein